MSKTNNLQQLNELLFGQLSILSDLDVTGETLNTEIKRADSMTKLSAQIISNARLALDAAEFREEYSTTKEPAQLPDMFSRTV